MGSELTREEVREIVKQNYGGSFLSHVGTLELRTVQVPGYTLHVVVPPESAYFPVPVIFDWWLA